ncbi:MAG TPA: VOC family protein [Chitinophagaceae bacterium]|nr:VOC family protein [Chitinophagaceae bacterium]
MPTIHTYLNFSGTTEEAFRFYQSVFGGEFRNLQRYRDTPFADKVAGADKDKIMHIALPVGAHSVLMGTDSLPGMGPALQVGNHCHLSLDVSSEQEARQLFDGLSRGGQVTMPLEMSFWGALFGMFTDRFGVSWMINYDQGQPA